MRPARGPGLGARLSLDRGASESCSAQMPAASEKRHAERGEPLSSRLGVGLYYAGAHSALGPDDHGAVPVSVASGNRDKTLEECARCGRVAGESEQPPGGGVAPWEITLCVDAGA